MRANHSKIVPTVLVVFGATGDLMTKKIVPALYQLFQEGKLPKLFQVIGVARRDLSDTAFRERLEEILKNHDIDSITTEAKQFLERFSYHQGEFTNLNDYQRLATSLGRIDDKWQACSNKLFYLAVPPEFTETIFEHLASSGLTIPCSPEEGWTRVLVEKPFGKDATTARALDERLGQLFREIQIFRIDHYLAKEMLQNIIAFRFANNLFEGTWNNQFIERIEVRLWETLGVEDRGTFYDGVGALRDVGQNHHLQMLALLTMDHPGDFSTDGMRQKRAEILKQLRMLTSDDMKKQTARGQYAGYQRIKGVAPNSQTETFFRIEAELATPRWEGVPIILEGGKRLAEQRKEVIVTLRHPSPCLCPPGQHVPNQVVISLEPEERITIRFWSKKPGLQLELEERSFDFLYRTREKKSQYVEEYVKLLLDCLNGDQLLFVSTDEVKAMWRFIDPISEAWQKNDVPLTEYPPGTYPTFPLAKTSTETLPKTIGLVGLGKMGGNLARQLLEKDWQVVGYNRTPSVTNDLKEVGLTPAFSLTELVAALPNPRVIWLMVPAGAAMDETLDQLLPLLAKGDIVIDGGNSLYKDSIRRAKRLENHGVEFIDIGTSGGPSGARHGASLMIGGKANVFQQLEPLIQDISVVHGYQFFEGAGAGHFVKMVHNGIEYGIMQAIAEGFEIMQAAPFKLDLTRVADIYNHGSVIESRLIAWLKDAFLEHGVDLADVTSTVAHTGEGAWTVEAAQELKVPANIIAGALEFRKQSAKDPRFAGKILSALREQFGGHASR